MSDERLAEAVEAIAVRLDSGSIVGRTIVDAIDDLAGAINRVAEALENSDDEDDE